MSNRLMAALGAVALCSMAATVSAEAQTAQAPFQGPALAQDRVLARAIDTLTVTSPDFQPGGPIPLLHSGYGKSTSFRVNWTPGPKGTKGYAVIVEDLDSHGPATSLQWLVYNIAPDVTSLGKSVRTRAEIEGPKGFKQGRNSLGGIGYVGPHPAVGEPPHKYHVQVFALSRPLGLGGGADLDQVIQAMNGHVVAEGELIGTFQAPDPSAPAETKKGKS